MGADAPRRTSANDAESEASLPTRLFHRGTAALIEALRSGAQRVPLERAVGFGARLGRAYARLGGPRTSDARINLRIAYPALSDVARERMLVETYENFGRMVMETASLPRFSREDLLAIADTEGFEHLERAMKASPDGGAIVLTAHFGSFELFAAIMAARGIPLSIVHRTANNPELDRLITGWREAAGIQVIRRGTAARAVLRALRSGRVVVMPLDQDTRKEEGVFVPFFGRLASTRDGPARLAMRTGCPVVPAFMFRLGATARHRIRILPALELIPEGPDRAGTDASAAENVVRMTQAIEAAVREAPTQWIWSHRRWKTQPKGTPRPYGRKADRPLRRLRKRLAGWRDRAGPR